MVQLDGVHDAVDVDGPVGHAGVVRVPQQVVHLVRVHRAVDDLPQVVVLVEICLDPFQRELLLAAQVRPPGGDDEVGHQVGGDALRLQHLGDRPLVSDDLPLLRIDGLEIALDERPSDVRVGHPGPLLQDAFQGVRIGGMADVVEQRRRQNPPPFLFRDLQRRGHSGGDLVGAEGMLHPGVVRPGEDKVGQSELVHAVQALDLGPLEQVQVDAAQLDAAVDAVMDDLVIWHRRKIRIGLYIGFENRNPG